MNILIKNLKSTLVKVGIRLDIAISQRVDIFETGKPVIKLTSLGAVLPLS